MAYLSVLEKCEIDPVRYSKPRSVPKFNRFVPGPHPPTDKISLNRSTTFWVILFIDKQTNKPTKVKTSRPFSSVVRSSAAFLYRYSWLLFPSFLPSTLYTLQPRRLFYPSPTDREGIQHVGLNSTRLIHYNSRDRPQKVFKPITIDKTTLWRCWTFKGSSTRW